MGESYFDGKLIQQVGYGILAALLIGITLGIATPWVVCMFQKWETKHTVIEGKRLRFDGNGGQLFGKYIVWYLLTIVTFGIYSLWLGIKMKKWVAKHTFFAN